MDAQATIRIAKLDEVLKKVPYQYQNQARVRSDVAALLRTCSTLQPQLGTFSGSGRQVTLFYLYGVLPITYNGATYNIPVTIYFDPPYPNQPPRCFVTPSQGMALKPGHPHVDSGGMVYLPYLNGWNGRSSTLTELVGYLASAFSANPPVYATAASSRPSAAAAAATATPASAAAAQQDSSGGVFQAVGSALGGLFGGRTDQPETPVVQAQPVTAQAQSAGGYPKAGQPVATVTATPVATVTAIPIPRNRKEQLVLAVTSRLQERWAPVLQPVVDDINKQRAKQLELEAGAKAISDEVQSVAAAAEQATEQERKLQESESELRTFVSANAGREPDPDELREELDPDTRQILDCLAEEHALEEFLVGLDELLAAHKISTEDFLREVRDVSRRQFLCRMQRQKSMKAVAAAAGVPEPAPVVVAAAAAPVLPVAVASAAQAVATAPLPTAERAPVPAGGRRQLVAA
mmetsp:Transcript_5852/g.17401  ORF Transcript_5852/g.17401 Transcript_5852/m.17401 type:complete len:463 (-) Transcript_5852:116-1504(-)